MADTLGLEPSGRKAVGVQLPPLANFATAKFSDTRYTIHGTLKDPRKPLDTPI